MMMERRLKILMISGVTILCGFIVAGNIHDPGTNLLFVQHVFSMDTIVPVSAMADHAISSPLLWRIAFWLIVTGEGLTAALFAFGAVELFRARNGRRAGFSPSQAVCLRRGRLRIRGLVHRLSGRWGRVVCDVAIPGLGRSASRIPLLRVNSSCSDLRRPTGP